MARTIIKDSWSLRTWDSTWSLSWNLEIGFHLSGRNLKFMNIMVWTQTCCILHWCFFIEVGKCEPRWPHSNLHIGQQGKSNVSHLPPPPLRPCTAHGNASTKLMLWRYWWKLHERWWTLFPFHHNGRYMEVCPKQIVDVYMVSQAGLDFVSSLAYIWFYF